MSTALHPQTDGQTEHIDQEIKQYLCLFINYHIDDWADWLPLAEFSYNNQASSATGYLPFFVNKGCEVNTGTAPTPRPTNCIESPDKFASQMQRVCKETKVVLKGAAEDMKQFYDWKHKPEEFKEEDKVWLNAEHIVTGCLKKKLDWKRLGPFKISPTAYCLKRPQGWHMHPTFHVSKLRQFTPDTFNHPTPRVTLNVHRENWEPAKILQS